MRIALISDIHGNLVALEAALQEIESLSPDQLICLGDVAATGPKPRETLARLRDLALPVVMGNTDYELIESEPIAIPTEGPARMFAETDAWCRDQLQAQDLDFIRSFQPRIEIELDHEHTLLCFHGSPASNRDVIRASTPEQEVEEMLSGFEASLMAGGHTHVTLLRRHRETILINPGSVGLPYIKDRDELWNPPWAEYALLEWEDGHCAISFRRTPVDVGRVVNAVLHSGMPYARKWAENWRR